MARYIDAEELYRATVKRIAEANEARMAVVDDEFLDLINDAFTEDVAPRAAWISVEERLPDNNMERVLVFLMDDDFTKPIGDNKIDTDRFVDGKWVRWSRFVTHWMPLPEPPTKKGE